MQCSPNRPQPTSREQSQGPQLPKQGRQHLPRCQCQLLLRHQPKCRAGLRAPQLKSPAARNRHSPDRALSPSRPRRRRRSRFTKERLRHFKTRVLLPRRAPHKSRAAPILSQDPLLRWSPLSPHKQTPQSGRSSAGRLLLRKCARGERRISKRHKLSVQNHTPQRTFLPWLQRQPTSPNLLRN